MTDADTKPVPVTASVEPLSLVVIVAGVTAVTIGAGLLMANATLFDVPPPGAGDVTVTCAVPAAAMSDACNVACNCVALTKVVGRALPFHITVDDEMKPEPLTVSVVTELPRVALAGDSVVTEGVALLTIVVGGGVVLLPPPQPTNASSKRQTRPAPIDKR